MVYQAHLAREIVRTVRERGWNLYNVINPGHIDFEYIIDDGPVDKVLLDKAYVILPRVNHSRDPREVLTTFQTIQRRLSPERAPSLILNGTEERTPVKFIRMKERNVVVTAESKQREFFSYNGLIQRMRTLRHTFCLK